MNEVTDVDPQETQEWKDALEAVIEHQGPERAHFLIEALVEKARRSGAYLPYSAETAYINTIPPAHEKKRPGDPALEQRIDSLVRWNAMAMVLRANKEHSGLGGHIASYASAATLYEVGFNHFFRASTPEQPGDLVYMQGHSAPGIYARAFLEGRLTEAELDKFRRETGGDGLSAYPHPRLMPDFWQFATVSMGLGPLMAIYQARFLKYLHHRDIADTAGRKVWCFAGDGEMDEPESLGAISLAVRENLDNLVFVVNCNLQRLDGPVRGNGKIIQELERVFRGAGWNVLKVIWGSGWDDLLARDRHGLLRKRMMECVDGEYQRFKARDGAFVREYFFGVDPELAAMVAHLSDDAIWRLGRGGLDPDKVYAAYAQAVEHTGRPTVILAKTIKGFGMGGMAGEGQNITHSQKKLGAEALQRFRDRFAIPIPDEDLAAAPFYKPSPGSPEAKYLQEHRDALGGPLPSRSEVAPALEAPPLSAFEGLLGGSGKRTISTTMVFVRLLTQLLRDKQIGSNLVPIVADEARTFGMEGMFRQVAIYAPSGQLYEPEDADKLMYYREERNGQILQEGLTEAGSLCSWIAAATSGASNGVHMVPFFVFYSMFGFQRVGDLIWAAADMRCRGFLLGATSGRTTLNGEGLQHQDGHSHVIASTVPSCIAYDPTFGYEFAVIVQDGLRRMYADGEAVFYYVTLLNENYVQPAMPEGAEDGIRRGLYLLSEGDAGDGPRVQLMGCGSILREVIAAAALLRDDWGIAADIWSATSFTELARDGRGADRWNRMHPGEAPRRAYVAEQLEGREGPVVASTDYMGAFAEQIRPWVGRRFVTLGTDGFGRSDTRAALRDWFEVDRHYVVHAVLVALADEDALGYEKAAEAMERYGIRADKLDPTEV